MLRGPVSTGIASAGQELASNREKGLPTPGSTLDPALLSRLLLCQYSSLVTSLDKCPGDWSVPTQAAAQALQLHATLRSAAGTPAASACADRFIACTTCIQKRRASRHDMAYASIHEYSKTTVLGVCLFCNMRHTHVFKTVTLGVES